ncbi:MAG TPA: cobalt-precorrin 5A hydrolase [Candidatus Deferrimicrobium sp.]|nr:cobalt-precorrin 5A hydrolase [Candidatus Deferrimicrobium sp.]
MNIAIVALTKGGATTAKLLAERLPGTCLGADRVKGEPIDAVEVFLPEGFRDSSDLQDIRYYSSPTPSLIREIFCSYHGLILIMATGIAVRSLAPLLQGKEQDPAVVVVDERGQFAISMLSGHLGGANDLARIAAKCLGGTPVITTSTDVQGRLAVDVLARDLGVKLEPLELLKQVNSLISKGEKIELISDYPLNLPEDHPLWRDECWQTRIEPEIEDNADLNASGVILTSRVISSKALFLRPPSIVVGVGCRKGIPGHQILAAIKTALKLAGRSPLSIKKLVSIEAKAEEEGIKWAAGQLNVATEFYSVETLQAVLQENTGLAQSDFVHQQMGVRGVCEPASLAGCRQGKIILGKQAGQGVTVALAEEKFGW